MAYASRYNRRPVERASKISHRHIIRDEKVVNYLKKCHLPANIDDLKPSDGQFLHNKEGVADNPIKHIITVDGGWQVVSVRPGFPSSKIAFLQFGAHHLLLDILNEISQKPFVETEEFAALRQIDRIKLTLPISNILYNDYPSLIHSFRYTLHEFFKTEKVADQSLLDALDWLIFKKYKASSDITGYNLGRCPYACGQSNILLDPYKATHQCPNPECNKEILLVDIFRLNELIDDELTNTGANPAIIYLVNVVEHIILVSVIKFLLDHRPDYLKHILFIKDGPLAFFGQTANLHQYLRELLNFLQEQNSTINLVGLEKSGAFVDHADLICRHQPPKLLPNQYLLLSNDYIYKYITPKPRTDSGSIYGQTSYYSVKLIFKDKNSKIHVATVPASNPQVAIFPHKEYFLNLDANLSIIESLKCDMYDNALLPVVLANKTISIANQPSALILQNFLRRVIKKD